MKSLTILLLCFISYSIYPQEYNIPVVVHIVHNIPVENISDSQVYSQIQALNRDYNAFNADTLLIPEALRDSITDTDLQFTLVTMDPLGNPTNGITRTKSDIAKWNLFASPGEDNYAENLKSSTSGGIDPWNPECILNFWVADLGASLFGYAHFPGGDPLTDGVVIHYKVFGSGIGTYAPYDSGRVATHEVGHWLGLNHVVSVDSLSACFGEDSEPEAEDFNFMNYNDDNCNLMFFSFQKTSMHDVLETSRSEIGNCEWTTGTADKEMLQIMLYPNPAPDVLFYKGDAISADYKIINIAGEIVASGKLSSENERIEINYLPTGIYCMILFRKNEVVGTESFIKQ